MAHSVKEHASAGMAGKGTGCSWTLTDDVTRYGVHLDRLASLRFVFPVACPVPYRISCTTYVPYRY